MHLLYPALVECVFACLHPCAHVAVSPCLFVSLFLTLLCCDRFHKGFSLCITACLSLCSSPSPSFSGVTPFCHDYRDSAPICLSLSEFLSVPVSPSPSASLDALRMWQKSCEPLYLCISCLSLACCFFILSERCWMWKSCTSWHSGGWTSCTCEHKTSGDAVTSCLCSSPLLCSSLLMFLKY